MGIRTRVPTWGVLILGNPEGPILVDTGVRDAEIMERLHMTGYVGEGQGLDLRWPTRPRPLRHTSHPAHAHPHRPRGPGRRLPHVDAGRHDPPELEYSASGLMGEQYPAEYVKHHIDRLHTPGALRLLDLDLSGPDEIFPGIVCESAGGHTEGSMNVVVDLADGEKACICGDVIYDVHNQIIDPPGRCSTTSPRHRQPRPDEAAGEGGDQEGPQLRRLRDPDPRLPGACPERTDHLAARALGAWHRAPVEHRTTGETGEMGQGRGGPVLPLVAAP